MQRLDDEDDPGEEEAARRTGGVPRRRRGGVWRVLLPLAAVLAVLGASSTGMLSALRPAAAVLADARWELLGTGSGVDPAAGPEALKAGILERVNDADALAATAGPERRAGYAFDGCVLVLRIERDGAACERAGTRRLIRVYEQRVDLRNLLTHPAFVAGRGRLVPGPRPGAVLEELRWTWMPSVRVALAEEYNGFLLLDPPVLAREENFGARLDRADEFARQIESGEVGPISMQTNRAATYCTGERLVEPVGDLSVAVLVRPEERERLARLVQALGERVCGSRGWLLDW